MLKTFRYRLYPTKLQAKSLDSQLGEACRLYNAALQERRDAYQTADISLTYYDQANQFGLIAVEDLNIKGLAAGMLAKAVHDVGWGLFLAILLAKAAEAVRIGVKVYAPGTSQECPCGAPVPKRLGDRWHCCLACGLSIPRDHASALCIKARGHRVYASTWPNGASVA